MTTFRSHRVVLAIAGGVLLLGAAACADDDAAAPEGIEATPPANADASETTSGDEPADITDAPETTIAADETTAPDAAPATTETEATEAPGAGGDTAPAGEGEGRDAPAPTPADGDVPAEYQGVLAAVDLAIAEHDGARAIEVDDEDDGTWEVSLALDGDEWEVHVSADGTEILDSDRESDLDSDDREALEVTELTLSEAVQVAIAEHAGTAPIDGVDLSDDHGDPYAWDIEFQDDLEVHVDVVTGDVVHTDN